MRNGIIHLYLLTLFYGNIWCKIFEKCELATLLATKYNFTKEEVKNWVCIVEHESTFNTEAINTLNWDGSKDFGLFQINNRYWCGNDYGQNVCRIPCESLLDEDLSDDIQCAKRIVKDTKRWMKIDNGLVAWVAYVRRCRNQNLDEYISACDTAITDVTATTESTTTESTTSTTTTTATTTSDMPTKVVIQSEKVEGNSSPGKTPVKNSQFNPVRGSQVPIKEAIPIMDSEVAAKPMIPIREAEPAIESEDTVKPFIPIRGSEPVVESEDTAKPFIPIRGAEPVVESVDIVKPFTPIRGAGPIKGAIPIIPIRVTEPVIVGEDTIKPLVPVREAEPIKGDKPVTESEDGNKPFVPIRGSEPVIESDDTAKPFRPIRGTEPVTDTKENVIILPFNPVLGAKPVVSGIDTVMPIAPAINTKPVTKIKDTIVPDVVKSDDYPDQPTIPVKEADVVTINEDFPLLDSVIEDNPLESSEDLFLSKPCSSDRPTVYDKIKAGSEHSLEQQDEMSSFLSSLFVPGINSGILTPSEPAHIMGNTGSGNKDPEGFITTIIIPFAAKPKPFRHTQNIFPGYANSPLLFPPREQEYFSPSPVVSPFGNNVWSFIPNLYDHSHNKVPYPFRQHPLRVNTIMTPFKKYGSENAQSETYPYMLHYPPYSPYNSVQFGNAPSRFFPLRDFLSSFIEEGSPSAEFLLKGGEDEDRHSI